MMFSLGSGCASSIFTLTKVRNGCEDFNLKEMLDARIKIDARVYLDSLKKKVELKNYVPEDDKNVKGYCLKKIENYRRFYKFNK